MNAAELLAETPVGSAMSEVRLTVSPTQKIPELARLFKEHKVSSAPVVNERDQCIGIITSSDLVRYESLLPEMNARIDRGIDFEVRPSSDGGPLELVSHPFDEVQQQMTPALQTVSPNASLREAARIMCTEQIHHLLVLDESDHPVGILSTLDILAQLDAEISQ